MDDSPDLIEKVLKAYKAAVSTKDGEALVRLYDPCVHVFDLWGVWSYEGAGAWRRAVMEWFASLGTERVVVEFERPRILVSEDMAMVDSFVTDSAVSGTGEELRSMRNRLRWVLKLVAGDWKIVHEHTSAPVDPMTLKVILEANKEP